MSPTSVAILVEASILCTPHVQTAISAPTPMVPTWAWVWCRAATTILVETSILCTPHVQTAIEASPALVLLNHNWNWRETSELVNE